MSSVLLPTPRTQFRETLQELLAAELSTPDKPVRFIGGRLEGPQEENDIGCVWWEGKRPHTRDGNEEENYYRIRYFKLYRQEQGDTTRRNIVGVEEAAEEIEAALRTVLTTIGHHFFNVVELTADYVTQVIEIQLVAYDRNRSAAGG
jgi:hypothetical protein